MACYLNIQGVATPVSDNKMLLGDLFFFPSEVYFIPYAEFSQDSDSMGKFMVGGALMGGITGALLGKAMDSVFKPPWKTDLDSESAEKIAEERRDKEFGLGIDKRMARHSGLKITIDQTKSIRECEGCCLVSTKNPEIRDIFFSEKIFPGDEETAGKYLTMKFEIWFSGVPTTKRPKESVQGVNVKIPYKSFVKEEPVYTAAITSAINDPDKSTRSNLLAWLGDQAAEFKKGSLDRMRRDIFVLEVQHRNNCLITIASFIVVMVLGLNYWRPGDNIMSIILFVSASFLLLCYIPSIPMTLKDLKKSRATLQKFESE